MQIDGQILKSYRLENKVSREQLAERLGITAKTIQRIENGESTKESTIAHIEEKLGIQLVRIDNFTESQKKQFNHAAGFLRY
jgi:transcriptional regulator with XRE-family HTH domain